MAMKYGDMTSPMREWISTPALEASVLTTRTPGKFLLCSSWTIKNKDFYPFIFEGKVYLLIILYWIYVSAFLWEIYNSKFLTLLFMQ